MELGKEMRQFNIFNVSCLLWLAWKPDMSSSFQWKMLSLQVIPTLFTDTFIVDKSKLVIDHKWFVFYIVKETGFLNGHSVVHLHHSEPVQDVMASHLDDQHVFVITHAKINVEW